MTSTKLCFYFGVALMFLALSVNTASSQTLQWSPGERYDDGQDSSVAAHPSGLVLEAHETQIGDGMWYHVGMLNGVGVTWGGSQKLPGSGAQHWANFAITKEGYVIFVYSSGDFKRIGNLFYMVGKIDPYGGTDQSITWLLNATEIDAGFHSSIAVNENGEILLAFESGSGGDGLYYRRGRLRNPAGGIYTINWISVQFGIKYDAGVNPHIALNKWGEVVEVHEVGAERLLHYRRGILSGTMVNFEASQRYDSNGTQPAIVLLDNGLVVELHGASVGGFIGLYARTGTFSPSNQDRIEWSDSVKIGLENSSAIYSAVASNGRYAIGTWRIATAEALGLYYSVATTP